MKRFFYSIVLCLVSVCVSAEADAIKDLLTNYRSLGGQTTVLEQTDRYARIALADSAFVEMFIGAQEDNDKICVVYTVCAPKCSSCARVYNKEWEFLFPLEPPFRSIFPLATMDKETGRIIWTDNDNWEY